MIIRRLSDILASQREVRAENWISRRLLLQADGLGFSLHDTIVRAGTSTEIHYQHHLEAVYCIEGKGTLTLADGEQFPLEPGTVYALDQHDQHVLTAHTQMRMVCVFNPALVGPEVHDADGVYPVLEGDGKPAFVRRERK